jgi:hypothetical protein
MMLGRSEMARLATKSVAGELRACCRNVNPITAHSTASVSTGETFQYLALLEVLATVRKPVGLLSARLFGPFR